MNIMGRHVLRLIGIGAFAIAIPQFAPAGPIRRRGPLVGDGTNQRGAKEPERAVNLRTLPSQSRDRVRAQTREHA